jgi:hypothetical protein
VCVLLAHAVAVLHALAVLFMLTGALFALRRPRLLLVHAPLSLAILGINLVGADCPVTDLELWLRARAGMPGYDGGFLGHYLFQPLGLDVGAGDTQIGIYTVALGLNGLAYAVLATRAFRRRSRGADTRAGAERPGRPGLRRAGECRRAAGGRSAAAGPAPARPAAPARAADGRRPAAVRRRPRSPRGSRR